MLFSVLEGAVALLEATAPLEPFDAADALAEAIESQPNPPCDGCPHFALCASELMACMEFHRYLNTVPALPVEPYAPIERRKPTHHIYLSIYHEARVTLNTHFRERLGSATVRAIRAATGSYREISEALGVPWGTVRRVRLGKTYTSVV
jgi:hypothetical protein